MTDGFLYESSKVSVGFTGTRHGMTEKQKSSFRELIGKLRPCRFSHGDCIGADSDAHDIVRETLKDCYISLFPPIYSDKRAFKEADFTFEKDEYLARNRKIVDNSAIMVAAPGENTEQLRSGTWSTVRYARKKNRNIRIIYPDGRIT